MPTYIFNVSRAAQVAWDAAEFADGETLNIEVQRSAEVTGALFVVFSNTEGGDALVQKAFAGNVISLRAADMTLLAEGGSWFADIVEVDGEDRYRVRKGRVVKLPSIALGPVGPVPPDQMSALTITGGVSSVTVAATAAANLNGRPLNVNGYRYEFYNSGGTVVLTVNRPDTSEFTASGVPAGSGVYATVHARTDAGAGPVSPNSNAVTVASGDNAAITTVMPTNAVFDSGAARGANAADIPLAGTSTASSGTVDLRIVRADTGAVVHDWATAAGTITAGTWTGAFPACERSPHRLKAEVRVTGSAAAAGTMATDFMVGHVIVGIGQSEDERMFFFDRAEMGTVPDFADASARDSFFRLPKNSTTISVVNEATPITRSVAHMANTFTRNAPGEKVLFIDAFVSGSSMIEMSMNDFVVGSGTKRDWDTSFNNSIDFVKSYGADVGVMMSTWTAAPSENGDFYRRYHYPLFTGRYAAEDGGGNYTFGTPVIVNGTQVDSTGNFWTFDEGPFWDLTGTHAASRVFDTAKTRMFFYGPHRFEDALVSGNGNTTAQKQATRQSIRNWVDDPVVASIMLPKGPEIIAYQNGTALDSGDSKVATDSVNAVSWGDFEHPSEYDPDGLPARARHTAIAMLYALKLGPSAVQNSHVPVFNRADWQTTHADLWYEAPDASTPPITTTTLARGETLSAGYLSAYPHRTEVAGFYINGAPAQRVEIVSDRVRVFPDGIKAEFTSTDVIQYGLGGASATVQSPEDNLAEIWKNQPICVLPGLDYTVPGFDGIAMEPMPDPDDIASTIAGADVFTLAGGQTAIVDPDAMGAGVSGVTWRMKIKRATGVGTGTMRFSGQQTKGQWEVVNSTGNWRLAVSDSSGSVVPGGFWEPGNTAPAGVFVEVTLSVDLANDIARVWQGGEEYTLALTPGTGVFADASNMNLFMLPSDVVGEVEYIEVWKAASATEDLTALGTPHKRIEGGTGGTIVEIPASPSWVA